MIYLSSPMFSPSLSEMDFDGIESGIMALAKREGCDLSTVSFLGVCTHSVKTLLPFRYQQLEWSAVQETSHH